MPGSIDFVHVRPWRPVKAVTWSSKAGGALEVEGETVRFSEGQAVFMPAAAEHRFAGDEHLSVLAIFAQPDEPAG